MSVCRGWGMASRLDARSHATAAADAQCSNECASMASRRDARNHATAVSAQRHASQASAQLRVVSTFEHGSPAPSIAPRCSASNVPDGDMTVRGLMLYVVLAMVFSGAVGDSLLSVEAYHEGNRAIAIRQAQCHERMQAEAWPRGFMLDATLLLVRLLVRRLKVCRHGLEA